MATDSPLSAVPSDADTPLPEHKMPYCVQLQWNDADRGWHTAVVEVESPVNQARTTGRWPAPWANEPRYAWVISGNELHIAGWVRTQVVEEPRQPEVRGRKIAPPKYRWDVIDMTIPWSNVLLLQTFVNDDWEGKTPEEVSDDQG